MAGAADRDSAEAEGWAPSADFAARFFESHTQWNYLVKHYPSVVVCCYDIERLEIASLFSVMAVHRHLLIEGLLVRDHPFYVPAEKYLAREGEERERELRDHFQEVGLDLERLLASLAGYGRLQRPGGM